MQDQQIRAITKGLQSGQAEAWQALYDLYCQRVWRNVARLMGSDSAEVADVVQETFLAAARSAHQYDPTRGTLWNWLCGIARNQVALAYRKQSRQDRLRRAVKQFAAGNGELGRWLDQAIDEPADLLQTKALAALVRAALVELPNDYGALLSARYLDGDTVDEIAASQQQTATSIESKITRARQAFRDAFQRLTVNYADAGNEGSL